VDYYSYDESVSRKLRLEFGVCWSSNFSLWSSRVRHKLKFELQQDILMPGDQQKKVLLDSYVFLTMSP